MMIDFRVRPPYKAFLKLDIFANPSWKGVQKGIRSGREGCPSFENPCMERFMEEFNEAGTTIGVVMGRRNGTKDTMGQGNVTPDDIYDFINEYPDRFVGMGGFDVLDPGLLKDVERSVKELGLRGVCIEPSWSARPLFADDPFLDDLYQLCTELRVPVAITLSFRLGPDISYADPLQLERVAQKFPDLDIICPHAGWPYFDHTMAVMARYKNIFMIPDVYVYPTFMPFREDFVRFCDVATPDQILYASTYPVRSFAQAKREWCALPWSGQTLEKTMYANAARILHLD